MKHSPPLPSELLAELLPIVRNVSAVLDPEELLPTIAKELRRIVDYRFLDVFLTEPDGTLRSALAAEPGEDALLRPGEGIVGAAAETREPIYVPDVRQDPRYVPGFPDVVSELAIPLVHRDNLVGVLNIETPDPDALNPEARSALELLASHLAVAIENATLYRETRWYAGLLATLYEMGKEASSILDLDELLQRVAELVRRVIDYEAFGILLLEERTGELVMRKAVRYGGSGREKARIKLGEGLCGLSARTREPVLVGDVTRDPHYLKLIPETRSELVIPLITGDRVVGVFDLESTTPHRFSEQHVKILTPFASQVAVAIDNARLYADLRHKEARIDRELRIARGIQKELFPLENPSGPGWEAWAHFLPAREIGGDLYDFFPFKDGTLGLAVGDVSGKGVPAALYGAFTSGTVRARAYEGYPPAELMERVNRTLRRRGVEGLFCTLAYAHFDFAAGQMRFANSGLVYPVVYRAATGECEKLTLPGLPLGTFDDSTYEERAVSLEPGDVVVFQTDGVAEARHGHEEFGDSCVVRRLHLESEGSARRIGEGILEDVRGFLAGAAPEDDVTLIVIRVLGAGE